MDNLTVEVPIDLTPEQLATVFWNMDSEKQAEFFLHLADEIDGKNAELQFLYMRDALKKMPKPAMMAYRQLSVWAFDFFAPMPRY